MSDCGGTDVDVSVVAVVVVPLLRSVVDGLPVHLVGAGGGPAREPG